MVQGPRALATSLATSFQACFQLRLVLKQLTTSDTRINIPLILCADRPRYPGCLSYGLSCLYRRSSFVAFAGDSFRYSASFHHPSIGDLRPCSVVPNQRRLGAVVGSGSTSGQYQVSEESCAHQKKHYPLESWSGQHFSYTMMSRKGLHTCKLSATDRMKPSTCSTTIVLLSA
jgi:hypothetical protein